MLQGLVASLTINKGLTKLYYKNSCLQAEVYHLCCFLFLVPFSFLFLELEEQKRLAAEGKLLFSITLMLNTQWLGCQRTKDL